MTFDETLFNVLRKANLVGTNTGGEIDGIDYVSNPPFAIVSAQYSDDIIFPDQVVHITESGNFDAMDENNNAHWFTALIKRPITQADFK